MRMKMRKGNRRRWDRGRDKHEFEND